MSGLLILAALAAALLVVAVRRLTRKAGLPLPPGPKGLPLLGNALDMPKEDEWVFYSKLQETYGDLAYLNVLGQPILIVNSLRIASDLLEKRSSLYSGRMKLHFGGEMVGWRRSLLLQDGHAHREARKFAHRGLNSTTVKEYHGLQEKEAARTLQRLISHPDNYVEHFKENAAATIMMIAYGYPVKTCTDPFVVDVVEAMHRFALACMPGRWIVDYIPTLQHLPEWLPGLSFKKTAREWKVQVDRVFDDPVEAVKKQMSAGTAVPSMTARLLEAMTESEDETHMSDAAGSLFTGGSDTSAAALASFVLAMIIYPEVQKKAQAELDAVVGMDRLPLFSDKENLPYIDALLKEILRWFPIAPMGFPHRVAQDDIYEGYRIPKDTLVMANIWHMMHDKVAYGPDVNVFRPERFLGENPAPRGYTTTQTQEFGSPGFGFGRRVCPGQHLAMSSLFILCTHILATTTISPELDSDGKPILPHVGCTGGVIVYPKPFRCRIQPRSERAANLIAEGG